MFDLSDKVVLITGAGESVGPGIARVLAKYGATVIVCDESKAKADAVCELVFSDGGFAISASFGLTDYNTVITSLNVITDKIGDIDILINNVGTAYPAELSTMASFLSTNWPGIRDKNLCGFLNCCQAVLGPMSKKNWGRIITVGSSLSEFEDDGSCYSTVRSGASGFIQQLAKDILPYKITCNAISLEWKHYDSVTLESLEDGISSLRIGRLDDVGYLGLYLSTEAASIISGRTIPLEIVYGDESGEMNKASRSSCL